MKEFSIKEKLEIVEKLISSESGRAWLVDLSIKTNSTHSLKQAIDACFARII